jgi:hypothetical protein
MSDVAPLEDLNEVSGGWLVGGHLRRRLTDSVSAAGDELAGVAAVCA